MRVVLISTYDLGRQPFGLASPAAWLRRAGAEVRCFDLSRQPLQDAAVIWADVVGFFLPMHTATRLAVPMVRRVRDLNPSAHVCAYGLYAPMNAGFLRKLGVSTILGGEFEEGLVRLVNRLQRIGAIVDPTENDEAEISLARQRFMVPERGDLPVLGSYAKLALPDGSQRVVGYTEATRGCKHRCRHCPIVPVYNGMFRVVQSDVVLEDVRRQVASGAQHITFGDPDFFNGIRHAVDLVQSVHREFPELTYDVTIKVEHLLQHAAHLPLLRNTGCVFVTTAVESLDDRVLSLLDKHHTRADFLRVVELFGKVSLVLAPTFVAFHPWTTLDSYEDFLWTLGELGLAEHLPPIQLAIRLLIPAGSLLLELPEIQEIVGEFDEGALSYRWAHRDPRVDALQRELEGLVQDLAAAGRPRSDVFAATWARIRDARAGESALPPAPPLRARVTIPYLTEPWYC